MISIHAPTRGATISILLKTSILLFQSTLPREERPGAYLFNTSLISDFNPRSHERSDGNYGIVTVTENISIHAPTRGATTSCKTFAIKFRFQSTLPREERHLLTINTLLSHYFNPRSHERSDSNIAQKICLFLYNTDNKYIIR